MPRRGRSANSPAKASEPEVLFAPVANPCDPPCNFQPESTPLDKFVEQVALRPHVLVAQDAELADSVCLPALKELFDTGSLCRPQTVAHPLFALQRSSANPSSLVCCPRCCWKGSMWTRLDDTAATWLTRGCAGMASDPSPQQASRPLSEEVREEAGERDGRNQPLP